MYIQITNHSLILPLSIPKSYIHLSSDCVQFQDHDFVLGSLADFPAVFLEVFLADKHLVCLSVLCQAQLAELLPTQEEKNRKTDRQRKAEMVNIWMFLITSKKRRPKIDTTWRQRALDILVKYSERL